MGGRRESMLPLDYSGGLDSAHTVFAGAGLLIETYRQAGIAAQAERVLAQKRSPKGLSHGQTVECFVVGSAVGLECLEDMKRLRQDQGLSVMLGYQPPVCVRHRQARSRDGAPVAGPVSR